MKMNTLFGKLKEHELELRRLGKKKNKKEKKKKKKRKTI